MESTDSSTNPQHPNLPPGFRFHPTDEELVVHYLKRKATSAPLPVAIIADIDLYKFDPWELPAKASYGEQEWYFFSPRDRKYPNGARPNRAATSGYWKATGTDKPVLSCGGTQKVGVKKALVFYGGKPPKGIKTNWMMHEYRLADNKSSNNKPPGSDLGNKKNSLRLDNWVLCRIYKKANSNRPSMDPDRDDSIDDMMGEIPPSINVGQLNGRLQFPKMSTSYARALLENEHHNLMEGITSGINYTSVITSPLANSKSREQLDIVPTNSLPQKGTFNSLYWDGGASITNKRLSMDNGDGSVVSTEENCTSTSIASLLTQLPQTPSLHQQTMFGSVGDGHGLLPQPCQLHGMNWYT